MRELGGTEPVTPDTLKIGSVTKPIMATMAATLVEEGRLRWDPPLVDLPPGFATTDLALTARLAVADAFCACTDLRRQDLELIFSAGLTAEAMVASVAGIAPTTPFGEAFQYSNEMFATGGYAAAAAVGAETGLYDTYVSAMRDQVLTSIGMPRSTFTFDDIEPDGNYAMPRGSVLLQRGVEMRPSVRVITLGVDDLERSLTFYRDGLGLPTDGIVGEEFEHGAVVFFHLAGGLILALWPTASLSKDANIEATHSRLGAVSMGHIARSKEEVDEVLEAARRAGATVTNPPNDRFWGGYSGYFHDPHDPDGHLWEVAWNPELSPQE